MSDDTYNGWTNRETWLVKLWIDNERGEYEMWQEQTRRVWNEAITTGDPMGILAPSEFARYKLQEVVAGTFADRAYDLLDAGNAAASFWADLMGTALGRVNWREIAAAMLDDAELEGYEPHKG